MSALPKITVVTPSFNQAQYLEATMRSVLGQRYPNLEYIVMDGGSSDGSVEIIKRHESELAHWISEPDGGQANAINRGFARATGDILCWLNSDDIHMPDTLWRVAERFAGHLEEPLIVYGNCVVFIEGNPRGHIDTAQPHDPERLRRFDYLVQPSSFWTKAAWDKVGPLDPETHFAFDWDWFLRALETCRFQAEPGLLLSGYRVHAAHKSGSGGSKRQEEIIAVMKRYGTREAVEMYEWVRDHPSAWPALRRWGLLHSIGAPTWAASLLLPPLWLIPPRFPRLPLFECFKML